LSFPDFPTRKTEKADRIQGDAAKHKQGVNCQVPKHTALRGHTFGAQTTTTLAQTSTTPAQTTTTASAQTITASAQTITAFSQTITALVQTINFTAAPGLAFVQFESGMAFVLPLIAVNFTTIRTLSFVDGEFAEFLYAVLFTT